MQRTILSAASSDIVYTGTLSHSSITNTTMYFPIPAILNPTSSTLRVSIRLLSGSSIITDLYFQNSTTYPTTGDFRSTIAIKSGLQIATIASDPVAYGSDFTDPIINSFLVDGWLLGTKGFIGIKKNTASYILTAEIEIRRV